MPTDSWARRLLPTDVPLASSHSDVDPDALGRLIATLDHTSPLTGSLTAPQQSAQPPLAPPPDFRQSDTSPNEVDPATVPSAFTKAETIGASRPGERYLPPGFNELMAMDNPLKGLVEHVLGAARPPSVYAKDPTGVDTWVEHPGTQQAPVMNATTEEVGNVGRGLYSRIDDMFNKTPAKLLQPKTVAQMLAKGADPEEAAWRNLPQFLASKGDQPIPVDDIRAHLAQNPAPFPTQIALGAGSAPKPLSYPEWRERWNDREANANAVSLPEETYRRGYDQYIDQLNTSGAPRRTENGRWVLQGGENYAERLFQLRQKPQHEGLFNVLIRGIADTPNDSPVRWGGESITPSEVEQLRAMYPASHYAVTATPAATQPPGFESHVYKHSPDLLGWTRYNERNLPAPMDAADAERWGATLQRGALQKQMDAKLEEIKSQPARGTSFATPEEYHASPQYQELQRLMGEHNALNDQLNALDSGGPPTAASLKAQGWTVRVDKEDPYSGRRQMTILNPQGEWSGSRGMTALTPDEYLLEEQGRRAAVEAPTGPRVRHIEENQSDLFQRGEDEGYASRPPDYQQQLAQIGMERARAEDAFDAADSAHLQSDAKYSQLVKEHTRALLPPEWQYLQSFSHAIDVAHQGGMEEPYSNALEQWRTARDAAQTHPEVQAAQAEREQLAEQAATASQRIRDVRDRETALRHPKGVPDLPFKKNWEDLMLKQHAIDVAADPTLEGLTLSSGRTQNERYNLGQYVSKLEYEPRRGYLTGSGLDDPNSIVYQEQVPLDKLDEHIGRTHADLLRQKVAEHQQRLQADRDQWSVGRNPADPTDRGWYPIDPHGKIVDSGGGGGWNAREMAEREMAQLAAGADTDRELPTLAGDDFRVGGEGMVEAYDKRQRRKLEKLLAPHGGGKVLAVTHDIPAGGNAGPSHARAEPAWFAAFSPAMKASINKKGFPLAALLLALQQQNVGRPPPMLPVPSHDPQQ